MSSDVRRAALASERVGALARAGHDVTTFSSALVEVLSPLVPHSAACVVTTDPATGLLTGTYKFGALAGAHDQDAEWALLEYGTDDPTRMEVIARQQSPVMTTGLLEGGPVESVRFRTLVNPGGFSDELRMVARDGEHAWGGVNLFRAADEQPFDLDDIAVLASLSELVANGLRAALTVTVARTPLSPAADGPAVLIVDPDASVRAASSGANNLLDELTDQDHRSPADSIIHSLVAAANRYFAGGSSSIARTRLRCPSGRWLTAQAAPLAADDGSEGGVVITIDDARPPEIVALLASSLGLTPRERDVTEMVLRGSDTKGIAAELFMSAHTVQDHLKSIFDKADVRSRRELMARVFFEQYAPRIGNDVGPSGWFRPAD